MLKRALLTTIAAICLFGCKEDKGSPDTIDIHGITITKADGSIVQNDPDDWKETKIIKDIALYPNPTFSGSPFALEFTLERDARCKVWIVNNNGFNTTYLDTLLPASRRSLSVNGILKPGLYRAYIKADDEQTFGDLQVKD